MTTKTVASQKVTGAMRVVLIVTVAASFASLAGVMLSAGLAFADTVTQPVTAENVFIMVMAPIAAAMAVGIGVMIGDAAKRL